MSHVWVGHVSWRCHVSHIWMSSTCCTARHVRGGAICDPSCCLIHMCRVVWFICVQWLMHMCDMTYQYLWRDSLHSAALWGSAICDPSCCSIHTCEMTHAYVWYDSKHVWRDSLRCTAYTGRCYTRPFVLFDSYMWHDSCVWHGSCICVTWLICTAQHIRGGARRDVSRC